MSLLGFHCHIGSQIYRLDAYTRAIDRLAVLAQSARDAHGVDVDELSVGGGLGARYLSDDPDVSVAALASTLRRAVQDSWEARRPRRAADRVRRAGPLDHRVERGDAVSASAP